MSTKATDKPTAPLKKFENPFVFKNKGQIKPNTSRKPTSFQGGGGGGGGGGCKNKNEKKQADDSRTIDHSISLPATDHTSINRSSEMNGNGPCYSLSINKDDCFELSVRYWMLFLV